MTKEEYSLLKNIIRKRYLWKMKRPSFVGPELFFIAIFTLLFFFPNYADLFFALGLLILFIHTGRLYKYYRGNDGLVKWILLRDNIRFQNILEDFINKKEVPNRN